MTDPQPIEPRRRSVADLIAAALLAILAVVGAAFAALLVVLTHATAPCNPGCNRDALDTSLVVGLGGIAAALLIMTVGTVWSVVTRRLAFYWPVVAIVLMLISIWAGLHLLEQVNPD